MEATFRFTTLDSTSKMGSFRHLRLLASNGRLLSENTPLCVANLQTFYI